MASSKKTSKKHERRRARESALALLYSGDITEVDAVTLVEQGCYPAEDFDFSEYAEGLVRGVVAHQEEIDGRLASISENWALDRMPMVDRAVLRLAAYEMIFVEEVPVSVAINEAVELAKAFGGEDDSPRFVNGVLGRMARAMEAEEASAAPTDAEKEDESASGISLQTGTDADSDDKDANVQPAEQSDEGGQS